MNSFLFQLAMLKELLFPSVRNLRTDRRGATDVMDWTVLIIGVIVLFIIVAALTPTFVDSLTDYDNASTDPVAAVIPSIGPILLSVALLLLLVFTLLRKAQSQT